MPRRKSAPRNDKHRINQSFLNIDDKTPLDISTDGKILLIAPVRDEKRKRQFETALEKVNKKYGRALKRLAS